MIAGDVIGILSNNHVLAYENRAQHGDDIVQPAVHDKGARPRDAIAILEAFVRINPGQKNTMDCAYAPLLSGILPERTIHEIGAVSGIQEEVDVDIEVWKFGRTTEKRKGRITAFEVRDVPVNYPNLGRILFDGQVELEGKDRQAFSGGGDSGALVVDGSGRAIGLLFAGGRKGAKNGKGLSYANPIQPVLSALGVRLLQ